MTYRRTSEVLVMLAQGVGTHISFGEIVKTLETRAFALLVVVLGLPNCLPMPPPIPLLSGFLLFGLSIQMALGHQAPWFPQSLARQMVSRADIARAVERSLPVVQKLERLSRPRLTIFEGAIASRGVGLALLALSIGLIFAAPFVGQIPIGLAVCLVGLGLVERDGLIVIVGGIVGVMGLMLNIGFVVTILRWLVPIF